MSTVSTGLRWLWVSVFVLVVDQVTKLTALNHLPEYTEVPIFPHFNLTLSYNRGAAFSFLNSTSGWSGWLFAGIAVTVSLVILVWLARLSAQKKKVCVALTLVLGGALGNLIDRFFHGYVIDFLQFYAGRWYWPVFNIADSAICLGAFLLLVDAMCKTEQRTVKR